VRVWDNEPEVLTWELRLSRWFRNLLRKRPQMERCDKPPVGWRCTRGSGHEGPCAAVKITEAEWEQHLIETFPIPKGEQLAEQLERLARYAKRFRSYIDGPDPVGDDPLIAAAIHIRSQGKEIARLKRLRQAAEGVAIYMGWPETDANINVQAFMDALEDLGAARGVGS
jgi:hypothetical protein